MEKLTAANQNLKKAHESRENDYTTEINKLDAKETQLMDRLKLLDEKKLKVALSNGDVDVADGDLVEINAGGKMIALSRSTLTQFKGTKLEALFSGRWDKIFARDGGGRIFLDVNPICFQAIVDYLNEVKISTEGSPAAPPSVDSEHQDILMQQLDLFGLCAVVFPMDSKILVRNKHMRSLRDWLNEDSLDGSLNLLYRSSRNGRDDSTFHSMCDNKGPTLTVVETTEGNIIGGYSDMNWNSNKQFYDSNKAFLYAISKTGEFAPSKMRLNGSNNDHAIYSGQHGYGPIFGGGDDFCVHGQTLHLNISDTYQSPPSQISGSRTLSIKEMEVFQVVPPSSSNPKPRKKAKTNDSSLSTEKVERFSSDVNLALNKKWTALAELESEVASLEVSFEDEERFITFFAANDDGDPILLNVCGSHIATTRQTLQVYQDSNLASKILNTKKTESSSDLRPVEEWNSEDVVAWLNTIEGLDPSVVKSFEEDGVTGRELISLGKEGLKDFGVTRKGTIFYVLSEIEKLKSGPGTASASILIEHSPYCFEKIIDHLRLENLFIKGLVENKPCPPVVRAFEKGRFEKVVKHYFPGDTSKSFL